MVWPRENVEVGISELDELFRSLAVARLIWGSDKVTRYSALGDVNEAPSTTNELSDTRLIAQPWISTSLIKVAVESAELGNRERFSSFPLFWVRS
jgi:hypothetical protein